jgi:hypothetical protein
LINSLKLVDEGPDTKRIRYGKPWRRAGRKTFMKEGYMVVTQHGLCGLWKMRLFESSVRKEGINIPLLIQTWSGI